MGGVRNGCVWLDECGVKGPPFLVCMNVLLAYELQCNISIYKHACGAYFTKLKLQIELCIIIQMVWCGVYVTFSYTFSMQVRVHTYLYASKSIHVYV